jgi:hypothetical protein
MEEFLPGRPGGLKCLTQWIGRRKEINFFVKARQDGLRRREVRLQAVRESSNGCFMYRDSSLLGPLGIVNLEMITMCPL